MVAFSRMKASACGAVALHPAKPGQPEKRLLVEPVVARLRRIVLEQQARLLLGHLGFERDGRSSGAGCRPPI